MNQVCLLFIVSYLQIGIVDLLVAIWVKSDLELDRTGPANYIGCLVCLISSNLINSRECVVNYKPSHETPGVCHLRGIFIWGSTCLVYEVCYKYRNVNQIRILILDVQFKECIGLLW